MAVPPIMHATVVSHTHWDRAWYCTFQEFRVRLVRLIDRLIELLEKDRTFPVFMLDGQLAVLEDYLEVRPDQKGRLMSLIRDGRLTIGPWFVLPDEFLVSPEALIRNLLLGKRMTEDLGGSARIGYVPDGFGHIAQLPQILRGFGIDNAFFWRGVGQEADRLGTEFNWKALNGSTVLATFMPWGYHNLSNLGFVLRWGDTSQMQFDQELGLSHMRKALDALQPFSRAGCALLMNGIDHEEAEPHMPAFLEAARAAFPGVTIKHGSLSDHVRAVKESGIALTDYCGEFRWGRYSEVLQGVYSTRITLKQLNHACENLLEKYAEPLDAIAGMIGAHPMDGSRHLLATAWHWLLLNHPHDDIYGSGVDAVHEEMLYRFSQCRQIAEALLRDNLRLLARAADCTGSTGLPIIVFNPLPHDREEMAIGTIDFDFADPVAENFIITDERGTVLPLQVISSREDVWMETLKPNRKRRVTVVFTAKVPACGYSIFFARSPSGPHQAAGADELVVSARGMENRFVALIIERNGSLTVHDKTTGAEYRGLHVFSDVEDAGDEYSSSPCAASSTITTEKHRARVRLQESGCCRATIQVHTDFAIPRGLSSKDRRRRSSELVTVPIDSEITLYADSPIIHFRTTIENTAEDHKLSILFPTDLTPREAHVDAAFAVVARDVELPESKGWVEDPTPLMHQRRFTDLSDQRRGFAVLNRGLPSVEVTRHAGGTRLAVTLLRCVGWLSRDDLATRRVAAGPLVATPGAQMKGMHVFEYAILSHAGDWQTVAPLAAHYDAPLLIARADTHEGMELREMPFIGVDPAYASATIKPIPWPRSGRNPSSLAFLRLGSDLLTLSALKRNEAADGIVARFYNPGPTPISTTVTWGVRLRAAWRLSLSEDRIDPLALVEAQSFEATIAPYEIYTCELIPERRTDE